MKTPEEILKDHVPFLVIIQFIEQKCGIIKAMEAYAGECVDTACANVALQLETLEGENRSHIDLINSINYELHNSNEIIKLREKELQAAKEEIFWLQELIHELNLYNTNINSELRDADKRCGKIGALYEEYKTLYEKTLSRTNGIEEWLTEYRDDLMDTDYRFNRNSTINAINQLLNES